MAGLFFETLLCRLLLSLTFLRPFVLGQLGVDDASGKRQAAYDVVPGYVMRYAPLLWLHSDDPFRPADLLEHVRHTTPKVGQEPLDGMPNLDLDNLAVLNNASNGTVSLTSNDDVTKLPNWLLGDTPDEYGRTTNATACVVLIIDKSPKDRDVFYFYFYSYDRGANITQVMEPLKYLITNDGHGMHFGDHVGDWEHNMIRFKDGVPTGIWYSQHRYGSEYKWGSKDLSMKDERPVVYSAYGSHANYATPGDHVHDEVLIDYCDAGPIWDPVLSAYFYHFDPASYTLTRLFPSGSQADTSSNLTSYLYYTGIWGDAQYPDDNPIQHTVPRFGLKRFVSGPTGPLMKQLVRKGLHPDHRGKKSWTEWAVGVYMLFYPCCLRGWRAWVSMGLAVTLVALTCVGIIRAVRRYRMRKGYKKVETEIPLNDIQANGSDSDGRSERNEAV